MCPSKVADGETRGWIVPIGGAEDKESRRRILKRFVQLCGGRDARIAVIPTASKLADTGERYEELFDRLEAGRVDTLDFESRADGEREDFLEILRQCTGVFITGGNQFGSMTSYLTSRDFARDRPTFLVWENPIYNSLAQFGPVPMDELILAAGPPCDIATETTAEDNTLSARFKPGSLTPDDAFLFDHGSDGARAATVTLETASGITRSLRIERGDRLRATGRFFLKLAPYWQPDLVRVAVTFDRPLGESSALTLCPKPEGDDS